jgi:SAM-dependent methyltransferase
MRMDWLESGTGAALLSEESRQVAAVLDSVFGDQCLQIGAWGDGGMFRQFARTRRFALLAERPGPGVDLVAAADDLGVQTDCVDAVLLPHTLETTNDPHALLREVDRILRPDGQVVVLGFNAWGTWGLRHHLSRGGFPAGGKRMISERRLRDWLTLLDYRVDPAQFYHFVAPLYRTNLQPVPPAPGQPVVPPQTRGWHPLAACYLVMARKEGLTLTPIRPAFRHRPRLVGSLVNPTTRNAA